jgi:hypothetical protein
VWVCNLHEMTNVCDFLAWCRGASSQDFATWGIAKMETFMILNIIVLHTVNYVLFLCFFLLFFVWLFVSCPTFFLHFLGLVLLL